LPAEYFEELSEMEVYLYADNLSKIQKQAQVENLNAMLLAFSAGSGNKKAFAKIKDITKKHERELKVKRQTEKIKTGAGKLSAPRFTADELKNIAEGSHGR